MDFGLTQEQEDLREQVRAFIAENVSQGLLDEMEGGEEGGRGPEYRELVAKVAEKGWIGISWPKEYGGQSGSRIDQYIVEEEFMRLGIGVGGAGSGAPAILAAGTEEQKEYFIPGMIRGEIIFALGFTEPQAGADLAGLQCRAVRDGDDFVINGQKMYTSAAHYASHIYMMCRTDPDAPKHKGISIFLVPMDTPGITVRPLWTLPGGRTNEVFFQDVRVPKDTLLGERNKGWYIGASALNLGRAGARRYCTYISPFEDLLRFLREDEIGRELAKDPVVQDKVAQLYCEARVAKLFTMRSLSMVRRGENPPYQISSEKVWGPEFQVRATEAASQIMGDYHQLWDEEQAPSGGSFPRQYVSAMVSTFGHGSTQVMRTAIARRGLELPRE